MRLTQRQHDVLGLFVERKAKRKPCPTSREIADRLGLAETHSIAAILASIADHGYIRLTNPEVRPGRNAHRIWELTGKPIPERV